LSGEITKPEQFAEDDFRRHSPRFQGENFTKNLALVNKVKELATRDGCTPSQLALAWVLAQGNDIVPIPGTKRRKYLEENVQAINLKLGKSELAELDAIFPFGAASGMRYAEVGMKTLNG
jgi:aryl-alcohol dehydrogenase-like predicted oxidoreductase